MFVPLTKCFIVLFLISNCNLFTGLIGTFAIKIIKTHVLTEENFEPVILDCDYEADHYNSTLVVKWMKGDNLIYQWIKGYKPTVYMSSKGLINEEYETSENANYKYRAIEFPIPTKELSGNYKCSVQKINSTEIIQIDLHMVDVSRTNMQLHHRSLSNDTVVICEVENVFPTPRLSLWNEENNPLPRLSEKVELLEDGFFNATVMASVNELDENDDIQCTLQFSGIEYNITKTFSMSRASKNDFALAILLILFFVKFI